MENGEQGIDKSALHRPAIQIAGRQQITGRESSFLFSIPYSRFRNFPSVIIATPARITAIAARSLT